MADPARIKETINATAKLVMEKIVMIYRRIPRTGRYLDGLKCHFFISSQAEKRIEP
jgi:hypothetical protein